MAEKAQPSAPPSDLTRHELGRYELLFRLATGGMSELYVARLAGLKGFEKLVVIKLINAEYAQDSSFISMFIDEARLAARISHPNVVQVLELGRTEEHYFIAMEYVHGESLVALIRYGGLTFPMACRILADAAAGLHAAHELRGLDGRLLEVVHRDVSPSNILISYEGVVKVTDFGVARALSNLTVSRVGTLKGKAPYMAPEYLGGQSLDRRADIFALGVVLYEMTTARRLFPRGIGDRRDPVIPPSLVVDGYPDALEQIVLKALHEDPDLRYQTSQELNHALEQFIVDTGSPALNSSLGELMLTTFADRMKKKQELLAGVDDNGWVAEIKDSDRSSTQQGRTVSQGKAGFLKRWDQQPRLVVASGLVGAATVGTLVVYLLLPDRANPSLDKKPPHAAAGAPDRSAQAQARPPDLRALRPDASLADTARRPDLARRHDAPAAPDHQRAQATAPAPKLPTGRPPKRPPVAVKPARPQPKRPAKAAAKTPAKTPAKAPAKTKRPATPTPPDDLFGSPFKDR